MERKAVIHETKPPRSSNLYQTFDNQRGFSDATPEHNTFASTSQGVFIHIKA